MKFEVPHGAVLGERIYVISAILQPLPLVPTKPGVPFKVGVSSDPHKRLTQLQTGCPFRLQMVMSDLSGCGDAPAMEAEIHRRLSALSIGGEWFFGDPEEAYWAAGAVNDEWCEIAFKHWQAQE